LKIRLRQKQLIYAGSAGALIMLLVSLGGGYWGYTALSKAQDDKIAVYETQLQDLKTELAKQQALQSTIYVLNQDIKAGTEITKDMLLPINVLSETVPTNVASKDYVIGKRTKLALEKNTPLIMPMLFEDGVTPNDMRIQEFRFIELPTKLTKDDFVDVRIKFPTGEDFILLSKKKVKDFNLGTVWYELQEDEILRMSSGVVDAYLNYASIYAITYSDPYMQDKAIITYPSNEEVLDLMKIDPNIVNRAVNEMENRNRKKLEDNLKNMTEDERIRFRNGLIQGKPSIQQQPTPSPTPAADLPPVKDSSPISTIGPNGTTSVVPPQGNLQTPETDQSSIFDSDPTTNEPIN
jgi:hypothetical protein